MSLGLSETVCVTSEASISLVAEYAELIRLIIQADGY